MTKADAILRAIRNSKVGDQVIIHNNAGMVWCIIKIVCQEHPEKVTEENGGIEKMTPDEVVKVLKLSIKIADSVMKTQKSAGVKFTKGRLKYQEDIKQAKLSAISLLQDYQKLRERVEKLNTKRMDIEVKQEENREFAFGIPNHELGFFIKGFNFALEKIQTYLQQPTEH